MDFGKERGEERVGSAFFSFSIFHTQIQLFYFFTVGRIFSVVLLLTQKKHHHPFQNHSNTHQNVQIHGDDFVLFHVAM